MYCRAKRPRSLVGPRFRRRQRTVVRRPTAGTEYNRSTHPGCCEQQRIPENRTSVGKPWNDTGRASACPWSIPVSSQYAFQKRSGRTGGRQTVSRTPTSTARHRSLVKQTGPAHSRLAGLLRRISVKEHNNPATGRQSNPFSWHCTDPSLEYSRK